MWKLYVTAKTVGQRPSDLVDIADRWTAYQFDNAVTLVGNVIENASQETVEVGPPKQKKIVPKYHMDELLNPDFRLPAPKSKRERELDAIRALKAIAGRPGSGVKIFKANNA